MTSDMAPERITSIVLAAGGARRFGARKQLASLRGRPLLEHALAAAAAGPAAEVLVVLGSSADQIEGRVRLGGATAVRCPGWRGGRGASLRAGLEVLGEDVAATLVTLGDEPFVSPRASRRLVAARSPELEALRATYRGRPGHPVLIERSLFAPLIAALPQTKPAVLLRRAGVAGVECGDLGVPVDVDTAAQLAELELPAAAPSAPGSPDR
ncbi:MAG: nucleotidyltransferase family protein [Solirubrobacterales bacterium]